MGELVNYKASALERWRVRGQRAGTAHARAEHQRMAGTADVHSPEHDKLRNRCYRTAEKRAAKVTASVPAEYRAQAREAYRDGYSWACYELLYL